MLLLEKKAVLVLTKYLINDIIFSGMHTTIYRGYDEQTQKPVIIKALASEYPTLQEITRLRQEYLISHSLDLEGIVKAYHLERDRNQLALILEDFGGQSLKEILSTKTISLKDFLHIAISVAETLEQLHKIPILHKDINPSNIIINLETGQVKLTDFGIASRLSQENPSISNSNLLEGTLAYISPEQTGRMNRSIDYRTDLYSLGVTFYEMLTGQLPCIASDPLELMHYHLAKQPASLHLLRSKEKIPQVVSEIVMKLLAKNAEDRYQSATGLKIDLEICLTQLQQTGTVENFIVGQRDRSSQLSIPQKLYGREAEVESLLNAFARVSQGATELLLVSGYSGIIGDKLRQNPICQAWVN
jgi:serine/threonine protein kinase